MLDAVHKQDHNRMNSSAEIFAVAFGFTGAAAVLSNILFCLLMFRKPSLLKKPHNILLLTLAVMDFITGILILITPRFGILKETDHVGIVGYLYCSLIANLFIFFVFGKSSAFTVMLLAFERWFAVMRPHSYKIFFTRQRVVKYVALILVFTFISQINKFFEIKLQYNKCSFTPGPYGREGQIALRAVYTLVFLLATIITWVLFVQIWFRMKTNPSLIGLTEQARERQKLLLRMCFMASAVLTVCWLPGRVIYVLLLFGATEMRIERSIVLLLAGSNSFLNPCIYFLSNKEYRREFLSLFHFWNNNLDACVALRTQRVNPN